MRPHDLPPGVDRLLPWWRLLDALPHLGRDARDVCRLNLVRGLGPVLQIAEGYTVELPDEVAFHLGERTNIRWPTTWFVPNLTGEGAFKSVGTS